MRDAIRFAFVGENVEIHDPHLSIFLRPGAIQIGAHTRIDGLVKLEGGLGITIGEYVHISSFCTINAGGGEVVFGSHSGCASGVRICGAEPDFGYLHVSPAEPKQLHHKRTYRTVIGEYVVIFSNAVITPGVTIGHGAIIGAGSVVMDDVPAWEVWAGVPARRIAARVLYERLPV